MTAISTATFRTKFLPTLVEWVDNGIKDKTKDSQYKIFWKEAESNGREYVETRQKESVATIKRVPQRTELPVIGIGQGYAKRIHQYKYGARGEYTKEARKFNNMGLINDITRELRDGPLTMLETLCSAIMEYGDTALADVPKVDGIPMFDPTTADGEPMFDAAHTWKSDPTQTYASMLATFASLSQDSLQDITTKIRRRKAPNGHLLNHRAKTVVVPTKLRHKICELLKSVLKPEVSASNAENALRQDFGEGDYKVYDWLENEVEYYVTTTAENRNLIRWGWKWETATGYDEKVQVHFITIDGSFSIGTDVQFHIFAAKQTA